VPSACLGPARSPEQGPQETYGTEVRHRCPCRCPHADDHADDHADADDECPDHRRISAILRFPADHSTGLGYVPVVHWRCPIAGRRTASRGGVAIDIGIGRAPASAWRAASASASRTASAQLAPEGERIRPVEPWLGSYPARTQVRRAPRAPRGAGRRRIRHAPRRATAGVWVAAAEGRRTRAAGRVRHGARPERRGPGRSPRTGRRYGSCGVADRELPRP